jgi:polyvinyl alcohol dehydrogenase (cytochrome)
MSAAMRGGALGAVWVAAWLALASPVALAQQTPAPQPAPRAPQATPRPGYVVPPENSAGLYPVAGEPIFKARCATCHEPAVDRAPTRQQLAVRAPEEVYDALTVGAMKPMATGLSEAEIYGVVRYLTGKSPTPQTASAPDSNICAAHAPLNLRGPMWNGWSPTLANLRYNPAPGISAADVPRLKVAWAFSYPGTKNTAPLVFGDRVFVGSLGGKVYSLDAGTGCVHWRFDFRGGVRASMTIGPNARSPSGQALYVSDDRMFVHALDAFSGVELWKVQVDNHIVGRITGSPTLSGNMLYVPLSSSEESQGNVGSYGCCTFNGLVVAVDVRTGTIAWKQSVIAVTPQPTRRNSAGTQMYGPAGAAIWAAPTVDTRRGLLYVATGDSYSEVSHPTADAVVAMELATGKVRWANQVLANDNFVSGTINGPLGQRGPDHDFGSSPMLMTVGGRELLITGNKSSIVYAMDPDTGATVWQTPKLGQGGASGGVLWGTATDGRLVFAPLNDAPGRGRPGLVALEAATGREVWRYESRAPATCNVPSGRCSLGFAAAPTAIPGVVFAGGSDGWLHAFSASDGRIVWEQDLALGVDTVNGVQAAPGGSMSMGGPTIAGGRMFVHSGYNGTAGANNLLLAFTVDGRR